MANQDYEFKLLNVGTPGISGNVYPPEVIEKAIETLKLRRPDGLLRGEYGAPRRQPGESAATYTKRFTSIDEASVSHVIDISTMEIKDGCLVGRIRPSGPLQSVVSELLANDRATFALRSLVQFKEGNTTQTENLTVSYCEIISFDLVNS